VHKILFIAGIEHIFIPVELGRGEKIGDSLFVTNDRTFLDSLITPTFLSIAGALEVKHLLKAGAVAYKVDEIHPFSDDKAANQYLVGRLARIRLFLQMLWLVKDNAANTELGFIEFPYKTNRTASVSRNFLSTVHSNSAGKFDSVEFSREELRQARNLFKDYVAEEITLNSQVVANRVSRFSRAVYFLQAARSHSDLGVKIANYATSFEALFSTDTQELSHKLSERIACFLETDPAQRRSLFQEIKRAYSIRSKIVHGASGSASLQSSAEAGARSCDTALRRVLLKILGDKGLQQRFMETSNETGIEDYFLSLVLG
jgi:hypothetical protein